MKTRSVATSVCMIMIGVICLFAGIQHVSAQSLTEAKLTASQQTVKKGETLVVEVVVENVTDLYGIQLALKYDGSKLKLLTDKNQYDNGYMFFEADCESCGNNQTPIYSMIRSNKADTGLKSKLSVASFTFEGLEAGKSTIELQQLKAVSTEAFINDQGRDDLKVIAMKQGAPISIEVLAAPGPTVTPGPTPSPTPGPTNPPTGGGGVNPISDAVLIAEIEMLQTILADSIIERKGQKYSTIDLKTAVDNVKKLQQQLAIAKERKLTVPNAGAVQIKLDKRNESALVIPYALLSTLYESKLDLIINNDQAKLHYAIASVYPKEKMDLLIKLLLPQEQPFAQDGMSYRPASLLQVEMFWLTDQAEQMITALTPHAELTLTYTDNQMDAEKLAAYQFDKSTKQWSYMGGKVQATSKTLTFPLTGSGYYGVLEGSKHYSDLEKVYPLARRAIEVLSAHHKVNGTSDTTYSPDRAMTRAEFVAVLARVMNWEQKSYTNRFTDVSAEDWFAGFVGTAEQLGVAKGAYGKFNPHALVTREEMVVMLMRAHKLQHAESTLKNTAFVDDESISSWAKQAVYEAKALGFVDGVGSNRFAPKLNTKRADMAVLFYNYMKNTAEQ